MLQLKTKLLSTCEKYNSIKVPFKHGLVVKRPAENSNIMLQFQEQVKEGKGVVIMDKRKYSEKSLNLLNSNQFNKLSHDPTKYQEFKDTKHKAISFDVKA